MTYSKTTTIWRDDDCVEWEKFRTGTAQVATTRALGEGWTSPSWGKHYCPECSE